MLHQLPPGEGEWRFPPMIAPDFLLPETLPNDDAPSAEEEEEGFDIGETEIEMTRDEIAALRRLSMDGFEFETALQVFIACERDENAARECLLSMR
jgi:hypothetical protein